MTQPIYIISTHFSNEQKTVDSFIAWLERASSRKKRVVTYLKGFGHHGRIFPSIKRIADKVGFSVRHTKRVIDELFAIGVLVWCRRAYRSNEYFLSNFIMKIDFRSKSLFERTHQKAVNIDRSDHPFSLGKCHYTCHHNSSSNRSSYLKEENADVRLFSVENGGSLKRKREILAEYFIPEAERGKFMHFSERSLDRAGRDLANRSAIGLPSNWVGYYTASCQVYDICEKRGVDPKTGWQIRAQNKRDRRRV